MFGGSGLSLLLFVAIVLFVATIAMAILLVWRSPHPVSIAIKDPDALTEIVLIVLLIAGVFALALFILYVLLG